MLYSLTYRRPSHVVASQDNLSDDEKQKSIHESIQSENSGMSHGIPAALSFDRIIEGGTCPPVTVRDFMNYLKYIEYSAENLQFFLWYRSYVERWEKLSANEQSLSPVWSKSQVDADNNPITSTQSKRLSPQIGAVFDSTEFASSRPKMPIERIEPFCNSPTSTSLVEDRRDLRSSTQSSLNDQTTLSSNLNPSPSTHQLLADQAFEEAGMKWQPFTPQPFRPELTRIISIYLTPNAPRELNLSSREKRAALHALQHTTHPSALKSIATTAEFSLRKQAHPNFIRWTICNGNRPRVVFARSLGVSTIVLAFVADLLLTLSRAGRGWRVLPLPLWLVGISTLIAAWKGMCVVLHGLHHRHLRPWELFDDLEGSGEEKVSASTFASSETLATGGSGGSEGNAWEDEPWVPRYERRNFVRKIFDRQVWVREPALRRIQDMIFVQALVGAVVLGGLAVGIFCAVPKGNLY